MGGRVCAIAFEAFPVLDSEAMNSSRFQRFALPVLALRRGSLARLLLRR